jgi:immune inhibitor A
MMDLAWLSLISFQVDAFVIVHAGAAADRTRDVNDIWSVQWNLPDGVREVNGETITIPLFYLLTCLLLGTKIYGFLTVAEEAKTGVCAHELGHLGKTA